MPNVNYTEYSLETGKILRVNSCSSEKLPPLMEGEGRSMGHYSPKDHIIVDNEVVAKHVFNVTVARTGNDIVLSGLPHEAIILVEDEQFIMDDSGVFELELDQPIDTTFTLIHDLYKTKVLYVES